jgi:hypothetical protein
MPSKRGVFVEHTMGDVVQITAVAASGRELYQLRVPADLFEPRFVTAIERLLDRADPTLKIVTRG